MYEGAAIDSHRKYDPFEPSLDFVIDLINRCANENSRQVGEQLFKTYCCGIQNSTVPQIGAGVGPPILLLNAIDHKTAY